MISHASVASSGTPLKAGDRVYVLPEFWKASISGPWIAVKKLQKNWEFKRPADYTGLKPLARLRAQTFQVRFDHQAEKDAVTPSALPPITSTTTAAADSTIVPSYTGVDPGTVVVVNDPTGNIPKGFYVITRDSTYVNNTIRIATLGAGNVKMWKNVPRGWITQLSASNFINDGTALMITYPEA